MAVIIAPNSDLGKELRKWEQHPTQYTMGEDEQGNGLKPGNPYTYRPFPKMLYKASERNGKAVVLEAPPSPLHYQDIHSYQRAELQIEAANRANTLTVGSEAELDVAISNGWRRTPKEALEFHEALQKAIGDAAAEAAHAAQRMSAKAQAELAAASDQTHRHVVDVRPKRSHKKAVRGVVAQTGAGPVEAD